MDRKDSDGIRQPSLIGSDLKRRVVWTLAIVLSAGIGCLYLSSATTALQAPLSSEHEAPCLWAPMELAHGRNIYPAESLVSVPWNCLLYTPVYFCLGAPFQLGGGPSFFGLRLISMVALCLCLIFAYRLFKKTSQDRLAVMLAVLALASFLPIWSWSWKGRSDMLSIAFSLMALNTFVSAFEKRNLQTEQDPISVKSLRQLLVLYAPSIVLSVLAFYTKQPCFIIPIAMTAYLLCRRKFVDMVVFSCATALLVLVVFGGLQVVTAGGFLAHMRFASSMKFSMALLQEHLEFFGADWLKIWSAVILLFVWIFCKGDKSNVILPMILTILSAFYSAYALGIDKANLNHAFVLMLGLVWLLAVVLNRLPLIGAAFLLPSIVISTLIMFNMNIMLSEKVAQMPNSLAYLKKFSFSGKLLLSEDPVLALVSGSNPAFIDIAPFMTIWGQDGSLSKDFMDSLNKKKYAAVIINEHDSKGETPAYFWSASLRNAILENYEKVSDRTLLGNGAPVVIYLPKAQKIESREEN